MAYYLRRRSYRTWRSRSYAPRKVYRLTFILGAASTAIKKAFLSLEPDALDELFEDYSSLHGAAAARYARQTYPQWKSGNTQLSGQTLERLITLVPPYLETEQRIEIAEVLVNRQAPSRGVERSIRVNSKDPAPGFAEIEAALDVMRKEDALAYIPEAVMEAANWLYDDDVTAARAVLAAAESRRNEIIRSSAVREVDLLRRTVFAGQVKQATYSVEMPAGRLKVVVFTPSRSLWEVLFG